MHSKLTRRTWMAVAATLMIAGPAVAETGDISGTYRIEGRNPDGKAYDGVAVVTDENGKIHIDYDDSNEQYEGSGTRDGRVVTIDWGDTYPVIYVIMKNGDLHGTWDDGRALERFVRQ